MRYCMTTTIYEGDGIVSQSENRLKRLGGKALIVTGKTSAQKCGALDDVVAVLKKAGIDYQIFDDVKANPPIKQAYDGAIKGAGSDFVIGIGGGSPMDTAKGIAILLKHGVDDYVEKLFGSKDYDALPVVAVPTTSGTGSEVTPYSVFTDEEKGTKVSMARRVFPIYALVDIKYFTTMPLAVRNSTIMDALSHAIESYINTKANDYSELFALKTIELFGRHKDELFEQTMELTSLQDFVRASSFAGIAISQTGTSLPHAFGYPVTFQYGLPHGMANVTFMEEYLKICPKQKSDMVLKTAGFDSIASLGQYMKKLIALTNEKLTVTNEDIQKYTDLLVANKAKLQNHPLEVTREQVEQVYKNALL